MLSRYFEATDAHDVERLVALFADTGTLVDEGATRNGLEEIRAWANGPVIAYNHRTDPVEAHCH